MIKQTVEETATDRGLRQLGEFNGWIVDTVL